MKTRKSNISYGMLSVAFVFLFNPNMAIIDPILSIGIATCVLAKRITRVARQQDEIDPEDRMYTAFKVIGLLLILAGFICVGVDIILYITR